MNARVNSKDWLLLSVYLDGQLTPGERAEIEKQLEHRQELQSDLSSLRCMQSLLRAVPSKPVPRSFTLTTMEAREAQPWSAWLPALSFSSLGAALLLVVSFIWQLAPGAATPVMLSAPKAAVELQAAYEMAAEETQPPMIIVWGVPAASPMDLGMGGDGSAEISRVFLPTDDVSAEPPAVEMDTSQETLLLPEPAPPALEVGEPLPGDEIVIAEKLAPEAPPAPTAPEEEALPVILSEAVMAPEAPLRGADPILGVRPDSDTSSLEVRQPVEFPEREIKVPGAFLTQLQIGLAVVAVLTGLAAFWLRRKLSP